MQNLAMNIKPDNCLRRLFGCSLHFGMRGSGADKCYLRDTIFGQITGKMFQVTITSITLQAGWLWATKVLAQPRRATPKKKPLTQRQKGISLFICQSTRVHDSSPSGWRLCLHSLKLCRLPCSYIFAFSRAPGYSSFQTCTIFTISIQVPTAGLLFAFQEGLNVFDAMLRRHGDNVVQGIDASKQLHHLLNLLPVGQKEPRWCPLLCVDGENRNDRCIKRLNTHAVVILP